MALCAFMGDEVSAAGFRLAGVDVHVPSRAEAPALFQRLVVDAQIVLLTAEVAGWLPQETLPRVLVADRPLVAVIPDVRGRTQPSDLSGQLKRQLGMAE
jgi:vacuolar-type H+-ATPase subunit F/Vma7